MRLIAAAALISMSWASAAAAEGCFITVDEFQSGMQSWRAHEEGRISGLFNDGMSREAAFALLAGFTEALDDDQMCVPSGVEVNDLMTVVDRHWKAALDKDDVLPSQACAVDYVVPILAKRFPCPAPDADKKPAQ
jgi:hypothetical protein